MSVIFSLCTECKHFSYTKKDGEFKYKCKAFPDEIPGNYMFRKQQDENEICNNGIKFLRDEL